MKFINLLNYNLNRKMAVILTAIFLFNTFLLSSQERQDHIWMWLAYNLTEKDHGTILKFNEGSLTNILLDSTAFILDGNNASVADNNGDLLFYSNGCFIVNKNYEMMENGDSMNFSIPYYHFWANCSLGYNGWQDIIIVQDPGSISGYYVVHKTINYSINPTVFYVEALKYSYVDLAMNDGLGKVVKKNEIVFDSDTLCSSFLTAIKHSNGRYWWLIQMEDFGNTYYKFLIDDNGIALYDSQDIGPPTTRNTSAAGFAKFSPDGSQWAWFTWENGLNVFDFDRSTGSLSNQRIKKLDYERRVFTGIEYSPNGRFIYLSLNDTLLQVDTWKPDFPEEVVAVYDGVQDPFPAGFHGMSLAPDCKIYISSTNSTRSLSVINFPNKKGMACDVTQHNIKLYYSNGNSHPNFPRLRVDEEDVCDSLELYTNITDHISRSVSLAKIAPLPVNDICKIDSKINGSISLYDLRGILLKEQRIKEGYNYLDMEQYSSGTYVLKIISDHGLHNSMKIAKVD